MRPVATGNLAPCERCGERAFHDWCVTCNRRVCDVCAVPHGEALLCHGCKPPARRDDDDEGEG